MFNKLVEPPEPMKGLEVAPDVGARLMRIWSLLARTRAHA
jgi:hypothetical protein